MKVSKIVACASLLAVASQANAAQAEDLTQEQLAVDQAKESLRQAICYQNWDKAADIASAMMASSTITPEYRQNLVTWRHRFSNYARANTKFERIPNCANVAPPAPENQSLSQTSPSFAPQGSSFGDANYACYITYSNGQTVNLASLCRSSSVSSGQIQANFKGSKPPKSTAGTYPLNVSNPGF